MPTSAGVIILGPYRSGTSVTAQVVNALGTDFGPKRYFIPASRENPGGFFERRDINDANDALIRSAGRTLADPGDPHDLASKADLCALELADMKWLRTAPAWGIKDPRMCATLLTWIQSSVLPSGVLRMVHVRRDLEAAARSGMAFAPIRNFCDGTETGVRRMLAKYADLAQWHVDTLEIPSYSVEYERLIREPAIVVGKLAEFLGVTDPARIRRAAKLIGRGKGTLALQLERYFVRAPRRIFYFFTGSHKDGTS